ncbi:MAG TPA: hypothetical protein VFP84_17555 [Kofleriaceae bacterium]|nr:hypothetical protein [Kofleriaceae bacterium]
MFRFAILALCLVACGRSEGVADRDLPGLVVEARKAEPALDVAAAAKDPAELSRALARPYRAVLAALGPHAVAINSTITVEEAGKPISDLSDHTQIENGDAGAYHAVYTNSADYGRETTFVASTLYLRPRYQRWHARAPESADEPAALRDQYFDAIAATWDLLAPGAELVDRGAANVAGRAGRKIELKRSASPSKPAAEPLAQRKWRESRTVEAVSGEIVLDAATGAPLAVTLTGIVGFARDGHRYTMKLSLDSAVSGIGSSVAITAPAETEVVATPERLREVDDRDYLLQGIAPPLRRNPDGSAIPPAPKAANGAPVPVIDKLPADASKPAAAPEPSKPDKPRRKRHRDDDEAK